VREIIGDIRAQIGHTVIWWGILICGSGGFHDEMLVGFRNALQRDADRIAKNMNAARNR